MRFVFTIELLEVVVLGAVFFFASAVAAEVVSGFDAGERPGYDPCRDGRYSYGRAMSCDELLRQLDREEEERRWRARGPVRSGGDPCRDGRYSTGQPMTCGELRERLERRERRRSGEAHGSAVEPEPIFIQ